MPSYKLYYFDGKGRAEATRLMFKLKDVPFEDIRLEGEKWQEFKPKTPLGQMPVLEVEGKLVSQSMTIERYVAKQLGLYGTNDWEAAKIDMMVDTCIDIGKALLEGFTPDTEQNAVLIKKFLDEKAPTMLGNVEKLLSESGHCVGDQITWADIEFFNMVDFAKVQGAILPLEKYPKMNKMIQNVANNPRIAKWVEERPVTKF